MEGSILDNNKWLTLAVFVIVLMYTIGAFTDIMEVDAAQYASISQEMLSTGSFLEVHHRGEDYLDKPPLLFWLSSLSFYFLGISNFAYKLPSILFTLLGLFSTYRLGKMLYGERTGKLAALILGSCQAMILIDQDVRTDTMLTGALIFGLWQWVAYFRNKTWKNLLLGSVGVAMAMLTKGPIGIMMPVLALGTDTIIRGKWKRLADLKIFVSLQVVAVLLLPMCYGLYTQHGTEGLKFYFWTQSFGRLTGENVWANTEGPFFFLETFLWSFLPWTVFGLVAVAGRMVLLMRDRKKCREHYTLGGIILVFVAMSMSKYKLQHYVFIVYPLVAILSADLILRIEKFKLWAIGHLILSFFLLTVISILSFYSFEPGTWGVVIIVISSVLIVVSYRRSTDIDTIWAPSFIAIVTAGILLNGHFYPQLLKYQANTQAGKWIKNRGLSTEQVKAFGTGGHSLDFCAGFNVQWEGYGNYDKVRSSDTLYVYASPERYDYLKEKYGEADSIIDFDQYQVQFLKLGFLNPDTRDEFLQKRFILIYFPFNSDTANQAISPAPTSRALSSISKVGVCTPDVIPRS